MSFVKTISNIKGSVKLEIEGYYIERFINICMNESIDIWNLQRESNIEMSLKCHLKDYKRIVKILKKVKCKMKVVEKNGIPFIINKYKKRKIFILLLILTILGIIISSGYIWNVEIDIENDLELENIENDLKDSGLIIGILKNNLDKDKVINEIRLKRDDVAWIGIEIVGTNAIVKLVKAEEKPEIVDTSKYSNIISEVTGNIEKINVQSGTANVKEGDTIKEGDVLVNGWMEGKYTGIRYVNAIAEIEARVWYTEHINIPYIVQENIETGNIEELYSIKINNFQINFHKGVSKFEIYDTMYLEKKLKLFSDFYLPISVVKQQNKEIEQQEKIYTKQEAIDLGIEEIEKKFEEQNQEEPNVINKVIDIHENQTSVDIFITYEVIENIGINKEIVLE